MKSAYELAMERLREEQGEIEKLTDDQKKRLAEVTQETKAKIAEKVLALKPQIQAAMVQGDMPEVENLRAQLSGEIERLREQEESKKEQIRSEGSAEPPAEP